MVKFNDYEKRYIVKAYNQIHAPEKLKLSRVRNMVRRELGWKMAHMLLALDNYVSQLHRQDVRRLESEQKGELQ